MLHTLLVSAAYAQDAAAGAPPSPLSGFVPLILVFILFYFLLIRPQQRKFKAHQAMIEAVKRGDNVVTSGGVHGKVTKVEDDTVIVKIAEDVEIKVDKPTLSRVVTKPGADDKKDKDKAA